MHSHSIAYTSSEGKTSPISYLWRLLVDMPVFQLIISKVPYLAFAFFIKSRIISSSSNLVVMTFSSGHRFSKTESPLQFKIKVRRRILARIKVIFILSDTTSKSQGLGWFQIRGRGSGFCLCVYLCANGHNTTLYSQLLLQFYRAILLYLCQLFSGRFRARMFL